MDTVTLDAANESKTLAELIRDAREAMQRGRFGDAEDTCNTIVKSHPEQPDAWFLMGLAAMRNRHVETAVRYLEKAVAMRRGHAPYRVALGQAYLKFSDAGAAQSHFEAARLLDPASHEAAFGLAVCLKASGSIEEAKQVQAEALRLLRRHVATQLRLRIETRLVNWTTAVLSLSAGSRKHRHLFAMRMARRHEKKANSGLAKEFYEQAHEARPDDARPLRALGRLAFESDMFLAAKGWQEKALESAPRDPEIRCEYARTLSRMAYHDDALGILEDVHAEFPDALRPLIMLGWARYRAGQSQRAIADFDAVLERAPRAVEAHYGRARALVDAGQTGEAKRWLRRTLAIEPTHAGALRELATLKDLTPSDTAFPALTAMLDSPATGAQRRATLHMAAGAAHINVGDHADGFEHWRRGNALKDVAFDIDAYTKHVDDIRETFDLSHFIGTRGWGDSSDVPVFVVGMPRSGTSLVEQILASHSKVHGAGEREDMLRLADGLGESLNDTRPYPACIERLDEDAARRIAAGFLQTLRRADPHAARIVDKMPGNFHHVGLIATLFPNARIVHCTRDPRDTCLSIFFGDFVGSHPYSYDLTNLGRYYRQYERLMEHWHDVLPGRILDVRYEDMIEDQETRSRELVTFCGLGWESACLDFHKTRRNVRTRSNAQVRQPIYRSSMGRWKTYEAELRPLIAALEAD